jgi:formylglycine-generating enzyme required for sulfatase activity
MSNRSADFSVMTSGQPSHGREREAFRGARLLVGLALSVLMGCGSQQPPEVAPPVVVPITNMVAIKSGSFVRQGGQRVTISRDFWLGKFEVTQGEYMALMGKNPSHFTNDTTRPVEKLNYAQATAYGAALTARERAAGRLPDLFEYRLPTEAEWEYACRAGTTNLFSFGDMESLAPEYAWTEENSEGQSHPVGQKKPNPWGLHDVHGNVWEWCQDWMGDYAKGDLIDPRGAPMGKYRVFRGGGWNNGVPMARSGNRFAMAPTSGIHFVGLRIALAEMRATNAPPAAR